VFHLEIVGVGKDGRKRKKLTRIPVAVNDEDIGNPEGPFFLQRLAKDRYAVTSRCDAWSFMTPVRIDKSRRRVVVEGKI
jgi:hypothetical protein